MKIADLKQFAEEKGIKLPDQKTIAKQAKDSLTKKYHYSIPQIKSNFDKLIDESEKEAYEIYKRYENKYGEEVLLTLMNHLIEKKEIAGIQDIPQVLRKYHRAFDRFYLSLAQSRKSRAGKTFEEIHNSLFKILGYPFDEQVVINGKPDFLMPSAKHYKTNPIDCIIFTAKRTLRERWRQIVTEGTKGLGFFLATIDDKVSDAQLREMHSNRIYLVCPKALKDKKYSRVVNVLSFRQFFEDHLDPCMTRWKKNKAI